MYERAVPRARVHGAHERDRALQGRLGRDLGADPGAVVESARGGAADRPAARGDQRARDLSRRRLRAPARERLRGGGGRGLARRRQRAGEGRVDARGRHPARLLSAGVAQRLQAALDASGMPTAWRSPHRRHLHPAVLQDLRALPAQGRARSHLGAGRAATTSRTTSRTCWWTTSTTTPAFRRASGGRSATRRTASSWSASSTSSPQAAGKDPYQYRRRAHGETPRGAAARRARSRRREGGLGQAAARRRTPGHRRALRLRRLLRAGRGGVGGEGRQGEGAPAWSRRSTRAGSSIPRC